MSDRTRMNPGDFTMGTEYVFILDRPGDDGSPWCHHDPQGEYGEYWLIEATREADGVAVTMTLNPKMASAIRATHAEHGLGAGAKFSLTKSQGKGRAHNWTCLFKEAGSPPGTPSETGGRTGAAPQSSTREGRKAGPGGGVGTFGAVKNRYDEFVFTWEQTEEMFTKAAKLAEVCGPHAGAWTTEGEEMSQAAFDAYQGMVSTIVIHAGQRVPPDTAFGTPVQEPQSDLPVADQAEVDRLRQDLYDLTMEANLSGEAVGTVLIVIHMGNLQMSYADVLKMAITDFETFSRTVRDVMKKIDQGEEVTVTADDIPWGR